MKIICNFILVIVFLFFISACQSQEVSGNSNSTVQYSIGGEVLGINGPLKSGNELILHLNGGNDLPIFDNGKFIFDSDLNDGVTYAVTVFSQPNDPTHFCTVTNGAGTIAGKNISNIIVSCISYYTVGGAVTGLTGSGLILQNNDGDDLNITADGTFVFTIELSSGDTYNVTVFQNPSNPNQICEPSNSTGQISGNNISNVLITCTDVYQDNLDGTISDLANNLIWKKCSQGQNNDTDCTGTAGTYYYCNVNDDSCNGGLVTGVLDGNGDSQVWTTCNDLNSNPAGGFASITNWRVPTKDELKSLIFCSNGTETPLEDDTDCGSDFDIPAIKSIFPNTPAVRFWSSSASILGSWGAWDVDFWGGNTKTTSKSDPERVRCVATKD
jgi:hypothetical protein